MAADSQIILAALQRADYKRKRLEWGNQLLGPFRNGGSSVEDGSNRNVQKHVDMRHSAGPANSLELGVEGVHVSGLECHQPKERHLWEQIQELHFRHLTFKKQWRCQVQSWLFCLELRRVA